MKENKYEIGSMIQVLLALAFLAAGWMKLVTPNIVLLALAAFVAYGRWKVAPIFRRSVLFNKAGVPAKS